MKIILTLFVAAAAFAFSSCATTLPGLSDRPAASGYKPYTLENCLVTDEALDSKGGVITRYYQVYEVKVCCRPCLKTFSENPIPYLARLK